MKYPTCGDRRGLVELEMHRLGDILRDVFRHALDVDRRARGARPLGDRIGHLLDVTESRVVQNEHLSHSIPPAIHTSFEVKKLFHVQYEACDKS
jgi:hypothetical protein